MSDKIVPLAVSQSESGQKLLRFLERKLEDKPQDLHRWLRTGQIRRNGKRAKPFERVEQGDLIRIPPQAAPRSRLPGAAPGLKLQIIHEGPDLLVLNKAAGLPTQGGSGHSDSLAAQLTAFYFDADYIPAPAHRLDKDTSGLVLAAKNHHSARHLAELFADKNVGGLRKDYLAWVHGFVRPGQVLELEDLLIKDQDSGKIIAWNGPPKLAPAGYKSAQARALGLLTLPDPQNAAEKTSLVNLTLLSGRTHQLRVQMARRGHPVLGDPKYGPPQGKGIGLKLHAWRLILPDGQTFSCLPDWPAPWQLDPKRQLLLPTPDSI